MPSGSRRACSPPTSATLPTAAHDLEGSGAERIHVDVMDGVFVPNFTFGTDTVRVLRRVTTLPLELHLMIVNPDAHLETFATAGADAITVHYEVCPHLHRTPLRHPRARLPLGRGDQSRARPRRCSTTFSRSCDLALVMTIDPGFGGQTLIPRTLHKVEHYGARCERQGLDTEVEVDGGVDATNARACVDAGADVLVAGTAVFGHPGGPKGGVAGAAAGDQRGRRAVTEVATATVADGTRTSRALPRISRRGCRHRSSRWRDSPTTTCGRGGRAATTSSG